MSDGKYRGENWKEAREDALVRDSRKCRTCGSKRGLAVHHIRAYREFRGDYLAANQLSNLKTLCGSCHAKEEGLPP
jgi:5-methylcytosine-specific restriction endonuclease McrA